MDRDAGWREATMAKAITRRRDAPRVSGISVPGTHSSRMMSRLARRFDKASDGPHRSSVVADSKGGSSPSFGADHPAAAAGGPR